MTAATFDDELEMFTVTWDNEWPAHEALCGAACAAGPGGWMGACSSCCLPAYCAARAEGMNVRMNVRSSCCFMRHFSPSGKDNGDLARQQPDRRRTR